MKTIPRKSPPQDWWIPSFFEVVTAALVMLVLYGFMFALIWMNDSIAHRLDKATPVTKSGGLP